MQPIAMRKKIYLTFDAGYDNGNMPAILNALHKHQVHATFFVVGTLIREKPELIREIVDAGHTIGNHTMTHPDMSGISTKEAFQKQLEDVEFLYKEATGKEMTKFYRPPQGHLQRGKFRDGKRDGIPHLFLESGLCGLVSG